MFKCLIHLELIFVSGVRCAVLSQSCPTLCDITDCSLPGSSVHGNSPGENTGVDCHALLQGILPTQGWNPHLLHFLPWQVGSLPLAPPGKGQWVGQLNGPPPPACLSKHSPTHTQHSSAPYCPSGRERCRLVEPVLTALPGRPSKKPLSWSSLAKRPI